jgi:hypothetical protein
MALAQPIAEAGEKRHFVREQEQAHDEEQNPLEDGKEETDDPERDENRSQDYLHPAPESARRSRLSHVPQRTSATPLSATRCTMLGTTGAKKSIPS